MRAGMAVVNQRGDNVRRAELRVRERAEAFVGRRVHAALLWRVNNDVADVPGLDAVLRNQVIRNFHRRLHPHIRGPVLEQRRHDQPTPAKLLCVPLGARFVRDVQLVIRRVVKRVEAAFDAFFHQLGDHDAFPGAQAVLIVIKIGHAEFMETCRQRAARSAKSERLIDLLTCKAFELNGWDNAAEQLPACKPPTLGALPRQRGLDHHRDALVNLVCGDDRREQLPAALFKRFGHDPGDRHDAGRGVPGPGGVLPVEQIGERAVLERGARGGKAVACTPSGRRTAGAAVGVAGGFNDLVGLRGGFGCKRHAHGLQHDHFGPFQYLRGDILIAKVRCKIAEYLCILRRAGSVVFEHLCFLRSINLFGGAISQCQQLSNGREVLAVFDFEQRS